MTRSDWISFSLISLSIVFCVWLIVSVNKIPAAPPGLAVHTRINPAPHGNLVGPASYYPNPRLTPGAILTTDQNKVCTKGYAGSVRSVPDSEKNKVYEEYGITSRAPGQYEIDHYISLELGGSNDITNLWPEPNDHPKGHLNSKDIVENLLHKEACDGTITLQRAQDIIRTDWYACLENSAGGTKETCI